MSDSQETVICTIHSPMNGKVYSLEDVPDPAFARGMIGEGIAIEPEDGVVYAPVDGTIQSVFETEHAGKKVLTCKMHGWRSGITRADSSRQIFWVFREVGVKKILSEGGVGTINRLLNPRDLLIPDDYLDMSCRKDVMLDGRYLLVMRDALCPELRKKLLTAAKRFFRGRIFWLFDGFLDEILLLQSTFSCIIMADWRSVRCKG